MLDSSNMERKKLSLILLILGLGFILLGEASILLELNFLNDWVTPFCWTGYIFLLDGFLFLWKGRSPLHENRARFFWSWPLSAGFWLLFEGYNLILKNWEYVDLPANLLLQSIGYLWSFATILPALLETNNLLEALGLFKKLPIRPRPIPRWGLWLSFILGLVFLTMPLLSRTSFDFPAIWLGFIFLLEPILYRYGGNSLLKEMEQGKMQRLFTLMVSGLWMGFLWEFWNFWAGSKWVYHLPYPSPFSVFEMPLTGFLGFLPFGVEFYVMYQTALLLTEKLGGRPSRRPSR